MQTRLLCFKYKVTKVNSKEYAVSLPHKVCDKGYPKECFR